MDKGDRYVLKKIGLDIQGMDQFFFQTDLGDSFKINHYALKVHSFRSD